MVGKALSLLFVSLLLLVALLVFQGGDVPAWMLVASVSLLVGAALWIRQSGAAEVAASRQDVSALEGDLALHTEYSRHLQHALDNLQRVVSGDVAANLPYYVEQGVLAPARDLLTAKPTENVRLSVLWPRAEGDGRWTMAWAAGHSMAGQTKYDRPIRETLARHAYETGEPQFWPDVETQTDFHPNPDASAPIRSMVSLPIRRGDEVIAVFNAISAQKDGFDEVERTFLTSLAGVIAVAANVWMEQTATPRNDPAD
jgi:GAF domain-containing protein